MKQWVMSEEICLLVRDKVSGKSNYQLHMLRMILHCRK